MSDAKLSGTSSVAHLRENLAVAKWTLSSPILTGLDSAFARAHGVGQ